MGLQITEGVRAEVCGEGIGHSPRYSTSGLFVTVGPHVDQESHERFLSDTFGSTDWLWSGDDEFRFDKKTRTLKGVMLSTPEEAATGDRYSWINSPCIPGGLQAQRNANFDAGPMATRWVSADGSWMVCASKNEPRPESDFVRLRVADSLDLVFVDGLLAGWILESPANFLVRGWEDPPTGDCEAELSSALSDFLSILTEPNIEALQDGDPSVHSSLADLRHRLTSMQADSRRDVLVNQIDDLTTEWPESN
jgi:hypothetical protein